jgi:hypothetical protein
VDLKEIFGERTSTGLSRLKGHVSECGALAAGMMVSDDWWRDARLRYSRPVERAPESLADQPKVNAKLCRHLGLERDTGLSYVMIRGGHCSTRAKTGPSGGV